MSIYDFKMNDIDGKEVILSDFRGKVVMIVNTASRCGFTYQYEGLEKIYLKFKDKNFEILGFPANNFLFQEPGTNEEIKQFCTLTYKVTFKMFAKISVKGKDIAPLYKYLTDKKTNPKFGGNIKWNFEKFIIDKGGNIAARFEPKINPDSEEVINKINECLSK